MGESVTVADIVVFLVPMILSLSVHEYAHAQVAWWLGDDTAARQGRRTLNPLAHIDIFGTLLFPIMTIASGTGFLFGWARPVPVSPAKFTRRFSMKTGDMLVSAAGPLSNLLLAILGTAILKILLLAGAMTDPFVTRAIYSFIILNIALFLFNLLPVYPLDGSHVLRALLPPRATRWLDVLQANPMFVFMGFVAVVAFAGQFMAAPIMGLLDLLFELFAVR